MAARTPSAPNRRRFRHRGSRRNSGGLSDTARCHGAGTASRRWRASAGRRARSAVVGGPRIAQADAGGEHGEGDREEDPGRARSRGSAAALIGAFPAARRMKPSMPSSPGRRCGQRRGAVARIELQRDRIEAAREERVDRRVVPALSTEHVAYQQARPAQNGPSASSSATAGRRAREVESRRCHLCGLAPDDAGGRARRVEQDRVERHTVPPADRVGRVRERTRNLRRRQAEARERFLVGPRRVAATSSASSEPSIRPRRSARSCHRARRTRPARVRSAAAPAPRPPAARRRPAR